MFAFEIDERTVAQWHRRAAQHATAKQEEVVCNGQVELGQVQADEICVNKQGKQKVWLASAMSVFSRLWIWGEVSINRDSSLINRLMTQVRAAAGNCKQAIVFAVDGFAAYPKSIMKAFSDKYDSGKPGRPPHIPWADIQIVQVVKSRSGQKLKEVSRSVYYGCKNRALDLIAMSQITSFQINTAYIERLNATFRARMPALVRRTRCLARTVERIKTEMFYDAKVYNFCTIHTSLGAT